MSLSPRHRRTVLETLTRDRLLALADHLEVAVADMRSKAAAMRDAQRRGDNLRLTGDEVAFYEPLETNDSAVKVLGDPTLADYWAA